MCVIGALGHRTANTSHAIIKFKTEKEDDYARKKNLLEKLLALISNSDNTTKQKKK
jgi:hypothetical protein